MREIQLKRIIFTFLLRHCVLKVFSAWNSIKANNFQSLNCAIQVFNVLNSNKPDDFQLSSALLRHEGVPCVEFNETG